MKPTLVVLAGGMGSRYGGLKQLEGVGPSGETIVDYSVFDSIRAGFKKIVFVVRENTADDFRVQISSQFDALVDVEFVYQPVEPLLPGIGVISREKPWGTGHAVLVAREVVNDPFAVINADDYYGAGAFNTMLEFLTHRAAPDCYSMVGFELDKTLSTNGSVSRAICEVNDSQHLTSIVERTKIVYENQSIVDHSTSPAVTLSALDQVSMNFWGFHPTVFPLLEKSFTGFARKNQIAPKAEFYIPLLVDELVRSGTVAVEVLQSTEQWHGLTYAEDRPAIQHALSQMVNDGLYPSPLWKG